MLYQNGYWDQPAVSNAYPNMFVPLQKEVPAVIKGLFTQVYPEWNILPQGFLMTITKYPEKGNVSSLVFTLQNFNTFPRDGQSKVY